MSDGPVIPYSLANDPLFGLNEKTGEIIVSVYMPPANVWMEAIRDRQDVTMLVAQEGWLFRGTTKGEIVFVSTTGGNIWKVERR